MQAILWKAEGREAKQGLGTFFKPLKPLKPCAFHLHEPMSLPSLLKLVLYLVFSLLQPAESQYTQKLCLRPAETDEMLEPPTGYIACLTKS